MIYYKITQEFLGYAHTLDDYFPKGLYRLDNNTGSFERYCKNMFKQDSVVYGWHPWASASETDSNLVETFNKRYVVSEEDISKEIMLEELSR